MRSLSLVRRRCLLLVSPWTEKRPVCQWREPIRAHTLGQAYALGVEDRLGSIEVGKKADLVVLGASLFDVDMYDIGETAVHLTMMNGTVTHREGI